MKKIMAIVAFVILFASAGFSQTSVSITNYTSVDLYGLYTSGTDGDLLPSSTLTSGSYTTITYPAGYACDVTISVSYYDYDSYSEYIAQTFSVNVCYTSSITLYDEYYVIDGYTYYYN